MKFALGLTFALLVAACDHPGDDALERGFGSVAEMAEMERRGYRSKAEFEQALGLTATRFAKTCLWNAGHYKERCRNRRVVWYGRIAYANATFVHIEVLDAPAAGTGSLFSVNASFLNDLIAADSDGKLIRFEGVIGDRAFGTPDIEAARLLALESDVMFAHRTEMASR